MALPALEGTLREPLGPPHPLWVAREAFAHRPHNYLRGCKWAPDGSCVLTCSDDNVLRLFDLPTAAEPRELVPSLVVPEGDTRHHQRRTPVPHMDSNQPDTCLVAASSRDTPVHVWDAFDGRLRGSFCAYSHLEQPVPVLSLLFSGDGSRLWGGCDGAVRVFPTERPGRNSGWERRLCGRGGGGQRGRIGCLAASESLLACGSWGRSVGLYPLGGGGDDGGGPVALWEKLPAAPTHLRFGPEGQRLFAGGRKDRHILCWDLRRPDPPLMALERLVATNQRVTFDLDLSGRFLVSGDSDGFLTVWDTWGPLEPPSPGQPPLLPPRLRFRALRDCINGTSLHPALPLVASASGQRLVAPPWDSDEDPEDEGPPPGGDNRLQLWWWGPPGDTPGDIGSGDGDCHLPGDISTEDTDCHLLGDTGTGDGDCHLLGDTSTKNMDCHLPGDTGNGDGDCHLPGDTGTENMDCHLPGDTGTGDGDCHLLGDTRTKNMDCHLPGDTRTKNMDCHLPGDTRTENMDCHLPGDTGTGDGDCHLPGDTGSGDTN
ncbi:telomerase Cajal body protein 1 [Phaenicophaeus curvirostris]|uniref:telomerase Cajal body protein 1 n=1 Tax=Phaenicophaeus curvirostris TaxID=33595 RepID=UPI0037F0F4A2